MATVLGPKRTLSSTIAACGPITSPGAMAFLSLTMAMYTKDSSETDLKMALALRFTKMAAVLSETLKMGSQRAMAN